MLLVFELVLLEPFEFFVGLVDVRFIDVEGAIDGSRVVEGGVREEPVVGFL